MGMTKEQRAKEFIECLGNGKDIYQCESENEMIEEEIRWKKFIVTDGKVEYTLTSQSREELESSLDKGWKIVKEIKWE